MIKKIFGFIILISLLATLYSFVSAEKDLYKCMIQMNDYEGEGAYVAISLLNPEGVYEETLYVQGSDEEWYADIIEWWKFQSEQSNDIDAVTGATVSSGERVISIIAIDKDKLDKGYKIRFESSVEDLNYYKNDVEFELTSESVKSKIEGTGFIRYIRMIPQTR